MVSKRKSRSTDEGASKSRKKGKQVEWPDSSEWPEHFVLLFKTFKAINTVLAFVTAKKQLATSFSSIRSSAEGLLKRPLELSEVAEIKALLPELVKFSYTPASELHPNDASSKGASYDYSQSQRPTSSAHQPEGQVLVLEFTDSKSTGKKLATHPLLSTAINLSPAAVKKLIETRNTRFEQAVNELLSATPSGDDLVYLLTTASKKYIPQDPNSVFEDVEQTMPSTERPSVLEIISELQGQAWYMDQIVYQHSVDAEPPAYATLQPPVSPTMAEALLEARSIQKLYAHQVAAIDAFRNGKHVVVSTSTASGKSVIYQIPLLTCLEENPEATVILIFPTKALAQDQKLSLEHLLHACTTTSSLKVATYDGDTPKEQRQAIRESASVILTNFDTLHSSILPNEEKWRWFFKRLKILAVDEIHYYSGQLGSHVALILRRFQRVCEALGNRRIRFISCSATLANPSIYMCSLFGLEEGEVEVVSNDGAPTGSKEYLIWNPSAIDSINPSLGKHSSLTEASQLMRLLMKRGIRVILFCKIRKVCELAMKTIKSDLSNEGRPDILQRVRSYRGGYTHEDRRKIEQEAFSGQLLGIIATNALELGIDIGALDAVIMLGFPITLSNFKQQAGRAGRRSRDSLAVLVADPFPVDQYYVKNPKELFESTLDDLFVDVDNEVVLEGHLHCAAYEIPITYQDEKWFGALMKKICEKSLQKDDEGWYHAHPKFLPYPSQHVSIRGAFEERYVVVEVRENESGFSAIKLEEIEFSRALFELYEGGVFMHQGATYIVKEIGHNTKMAKVVKTDVNYITSPKDMTRIEPLQTLKIKQFLGHTVSFGRVNVTVKVFGFFKLRHGQILDAIELITPPWVRESTGFWIDIPDSYLDELRVAGIDGASAIHAAEHAFLNQFALADDVKTDCRTAQEDYEDDASKTKRPPRLMFYDAAGKMGGTSGRAFDHVQNLLAKAQQAVDCCQCEDGCTLCVQSTKCRDANLISSKLGANIILARILGLNPSKPELPTSPHDTIADPL